MTDVIDVLRKIRAMTLDENFQQNEFLCDPIWDLVDSMLESKRPIPSGRATDPNYDYSPPVLLGRNDVD